MHFGFAMAFAIVCCFNGTGGFHLPAATDVRLITVRLRDHVAYLALTSSLRGNAVVFVDLLLGHAHLSSVGSRARPHSIGKWRLLPGHCAGDFIEACLASLRPGIERHRQQATSKGNSYPNLAHISPFQERDSAVQTAMLHCTGTGGMWGSGNLN